MDGSWSWGPHRDHRTPVLARIEAAIGTSKTVLSIYLAGEPYARVHAVAFLVPMREQEPHGHCCEVLILGYSY